MCIFEFYTQVGGSMTMTMPVRADPAVTRTNIRVHPIEWFSTVFCRYWFLFSFKANFPCLVHVVRSDHSMTVTTCPDPDEFVFLVLLFKLDKRERGFQLSDVFLNLAASAKPRPLFVIGNNEKSSKRLSPVGLC